MNRKAIILVAGMGTRLKPRTLTTHKCLTKVNGTPIIFNALSNLSDIGVSETVLVIGYLGGEIKNEIGSRFGNMAISYVENEIYSDTNTSYSLKLGLEEICDYDELYVLEGDVFFEIDLLKRLVHDKHADSTLLEPYNSSLDGTFVSLGDDGYVVDWTHKSMREADYILDDKFKTINIHKFSKGFVDSILEKEVSSYVDKTNGKAPMENIMRSIVREYDNSIYGLLSDGFKWFEIDDENDLQIAEKMFVR